MTAARILAGVLLLAGSWPSMAQLPAGGVFRVDSGATAVSTNAAVAVNTDGAFVVVWQSSNARGSGVRGQRFDALGTRVGRELVVNGEGLGAGAPAVGIDGDGDFLVAWREQVGRAFRILGRRYDSAGAAEGPPFQVDTGRAPSRRSVVSVAMNHDGQSAVTWDGVKSGMALQLFDDAGDRIGDQQAGVGSLVSAAMADDGHGVVAAAIGRGADRGKAVVVHYFDLSGNFGVTAQIDNVFMQHGPSAAMAPGGAFVVVWQEQSYYESLLVGRRFGGGPPSRFTIGSSSPRAGYLQPSAAMGADGAFLVAWRDDGILGQWFDDEVHFSGGRFRVNPSGGSSPAAAIGENGTVVVVWERAPYRRNRGGIFARRFE